MMRIRSLYKPKTTHNEILYVSVKLNFAIVKQKSNREEKK